MTDRQIMAALVTALRAEFEDNIRADAGNRYSAAMLAHGLAILQRAMETDCPDATGPFRQISFDSADGLASAIRARRLTESQTSSLRAVLYAHVEAKLAVSNPGVLKQTPDGAAS